AWAYSRLAFYQLQAGNLPAASRSLGRAAEFVKDYPSALFVQAKIEIAHNAPAKAVQVLSTAVAKAPLPEYEWALADAARLVGDAQLAARIETMILERGVNEDQRSYALFLANRILKPDAAVKFAENELSNRHDVFTYDALAAVQLAAGKKEEARESIRHALGEGTLDARLFYHAGKVSAAMGDKTDAAQWFVRAASIQQMLLPSERADLMQQIATSQLSQNSTPTLSSTNPQLAETGRN
ncbi:MAG: tetratricopeptide repeat protein, partial [Spartobacteria bacterium]|nr:tetratricopeptide repeat protein [Spartobacteria bacterium]